MDTKKFIEMAKQYEETAEMIKSGEISISDMREALGACKPVITDSLTILTDVLNDKENDEISDVMRVAIKAEIASEQAKYEPASHREDIITLMSMLKTVDADIGEPLFMPFMLDILRTTLEVFRPVFPEMIKNLEDTLAEVA